jgi:hypothetical protein
MSLRDGPRGLLRLVQACALTVLLGCSAKQSAGSPPSPQTASGGGPLLPPAVYLVALDSLLAGADPEDEPTFVQGSLPIPQSELQSRHLRYKDNRFVCPGERALWFLAPRRRDNGTTELEVVEAFGDLSSLAGSRVFIFRSSDTIYHLVRALPGNSDYVVMCNRPPRE